MSTLTTTLHIVFARDKTQERHCETKFLLKYSFGIKDDPQCLVLQLTLFTSERP